MVRFLTIFATLLTVINGGAGIPASKLWAELEDKRRMLPGAHQEFDVSQTFKLASGNQSSKRKIAIDLFERQWRERSLSGSGDHVKIFDGESLFLMEEGGDEFVRTKHRPKEEEPRPSPYGFENPDFSKAIEVERQPCGLPGRNDLCVVLEVPLKPWVRSGPNDQTRMVQGSERVVLDLETGLLLGLRAVRTIESQRGTYQSDAIYALKSVTYGAPANADLFRLPSQDMREVKQLSPWNAARIKRLLAGKAAPELTVTDIQGKPVTLAAFKGRTVLLDFFTTWCGPCRADGPALDRLFRKYGRQDLMILGISVSEDRAIVEKYLKEHPHDYPVVLTTENEMPRPYQIAAFPTYIVIDREGAVTSAAEGDQGFADLRKLLRKASLEIE